MNVNLPLVSVIIPAYNAEDFIGKTLNSVLAQTYKNIEVLVVDDGSLDRTAEITKSFAEKDCRVILLEQPNAGVAAARNLAIGKSRGEYIAPIDADDIWYPQKLEKQVQCMLVANQSVGLVYAWSAYIDAEDNIIGEYPSFHYLNICSIEGYIYPALIYMNLLGNGSVPLIRRSCFDKVGFYNCKLKEKNAQGCEDWDIYLRISEVYQFRVVPEFLVGYRQLIGSMSRCYETMAKSYDFVIADCKRLHPEIPTCIYNWSASNFYTYNSTISGQSGDYLRTLLWLSQAIKLDIFILLNISFCKWYVTCVIKILYQNVRGGTSSKFNLLEKSVKNKFPANRAINGERTIADIQKEMLKPQKIIWKPYGKIRLQRWLRTVQLCRRLSE